MLRKQASAQVLDAWKVPRSGTSRSLRKAAHRVEFEYTPRPGYLYVRSRAISSRTNDNHDTFPAAEIEKSYRTFLGKPCFVNHHNANHRRARGVIVAAALHHDRAPDGSADTWVELLHEIDARRFPKLARAIIEGRVNRTSMGVDCEYSTCSACGNKATTPSEYCSHMPAKKGMKYRKRNPATGKMEEQLIHEICAGLTFFENSFLVEDPADPTAIVLGNPHLAASGHMAPRTAKTDAVNRGDGNVITTSDFRHGKHSAASAVPVLAGRYEGQQLAPDEADIFFSEFGVGVPGSVSVPSFSHHVGYVGGSGAQEPVHRVHARRPVALVQDPELRRNRVSQQLPAVTGRENAGSFGVGKREARIAGMEEAASPRVTSPWSAAEIDAREVTLDLGRSTHEASVQDGPADHKTHVIKTAAPSVPHPGRLQGGTCTENCTYGGTHCVFCHEPLRINLHKTDINGGWHHADSMRREHEATPAQPDAVLASIPAQQAAKDQARAHVRRTLERQGLPPRRDPGMPLDPFLSAFRISGVSEERWHQEHQRGRNIAESGPYYHGTSEEEDLDEITPGHGTNYHAYGTEGHAFATTEPTTAWGYAERAHMNRGGYPRVYEVRPKGGYVEHDPEESGMHSVRTPLGFDVVREMKPSEHNRHDPDLCPFCERDEDDWGEHEGRLRRHAITGAEPPEGHDIWARPAEGNSPVAAELYHNMTHREPHSWYRGLSYHGPYHVIRHPETRETHVVDAQGRNANPMGRSFGNPERDGSWGEHQANELWHGLESSGPDRHRIGTEQEPKFSEVMKERTPAFPHSRIDPEDIGRAGRPDARVHEPQGHSPEDEWHGPYEVVKHPQTGRFHVVDNAGRHAPNSASWSHPDQLHAERSRDYIDRRQQSKERARGIADKLFGDTMEIIDPGGTEESRQSERNTQAGSELMGRYAGGKGEIKFDPDEEGGAPYYHREHYLASGKPSGWYAKHYGGTHAEIYHHATGEEAHDLMRFPEHPEDEGSMTPRLHPDFDDISLGHALREWHDDEEGGARHYLESSHPRIQRWRRRQASLRSEGGPRYENPGDHPFFQANPVSPHHIAGAWDDATDDEKEQGKRWYPDAHLVAKAIGGGNAALGAGVIAAYSPRTSWPANLFNAARSVSGGRALGPGDGAILGQHQRSAQRMLDGKHHSSVLKAPKVSAFAHLIEHGGDSPEDQAAGHSRVVVDRHALSAALGRRVDEDDIQQAPLGLPRYYEHVADQYRTAARDLSEATGEHIAPHQLQAAVWLRQIRRNTEEDSAMRRKKNPAGGRGRVVRQERDTERWNEYGREHHPDISGQTMHLGSAAPVPEWVQSQRRARGLCESCGQNPAVTTWAGTGQDVCWDCAEDKRGQALGSLRRQAADPPVRVPPSVDTLRPEACPVCGDQDVFKGQRCPVCGFVAPPDIFRDPDIEQAQVNRQQLEDGKTESPLPEGPADEEQIGSGMDADEQLMHPDQIAPDGTPGVQPDAGAADQGMLGQGPDEELEPGGEGEAVFDENGMPLEGGEAMPPDGAEPGEDEDELADPDALDDPDEEAAEGEEQEERGAELEELGEEEQEQGQQEQDEAAAAAGQPPMTQGGDQGDQALAGGMGPGAVPGEDPGSPGKDQDDDDDDDRPEENRKMGKRTAAASVEAAQRRAIAELRNQNAELRAGLQFLAELAGAGPEVSAIMRQADLANPASPVPDPPEAPAPETTEQALAPGAMGDAARPGTEPGSVSGVPAQQTTTAITPGVEMQTAPAAQLIDVTAPVQGTNPSQDGGVPVQQRRIETDVRIDPDPLKASGPGIGGVGNDGTAFPWVMDARQGDQQRQAARRPPSPEDERGARTFASIRLAKLRVGAGLVSGDELDVASAIERDAALTLHDMEREIGTLTAVSRTASRRPEQQRYPRSLVPRTGMRSAPSFAAQPQAPLMAMSSVVQGDDDGDIFD